MKKRIFFMVIMSLLSTSYSIGKGNLILEKLPVTNKVKAKEKLFSFTENNCLYQFTSLININDVKGYLWDFGDGATSIEQNPVHSYSTNENFNVKLIVYLKQIDQEECVLKEYSENIKVTNNCKTNDCGINAEVSIEILSKDLLDFKSSTFGIDGSNAIYSWRIDGGIISNEKEFSKILPYGTHIVELTVNSEECEIKVNKNIVLSEGEIIIEEEDEPEAVNFVPYFEIRNLRCDDPAYDATGNARYLADLYFFNDPSNLVNWNINFVGVTPLGGVLPASQYVPLSIPSLVPGASATETISFIAPIASTNVDFDVQGTDGNGNPANILKKADQPNCMCNIGDDWDIDANNGHLTLITNANVQHNFEINQDLTINGSANIYRMEAHIVYVYRINGLGCDLCSPDEQKGMFSFHSPGPLDMAPPSPTFEWQNSNQGLKLYDLQNDDYTGQIVWIASNPSVGVDFNSTRTFTIPYNAGEYDYGNCEQEQTHQIGVRYTFTDMNCNTHSIIKHYQITFH